MNGKASPILEDKATRQAPAPLGRFHSPPDQQHLVVRGQGQDAHRDFGIDELDKAALGTDSPDAAKRLPVSSPARQRGQ